MSSSVTENCRRFLGWGSPLLPVVLALAVYANSFPGSFFYDDKVIAQANPLVIHPDLAAIFSSDYWGAGDSSGLYRPLTILSLGLNRLLLGSGASDYHLVNLLLHGGVVLSLFLCLAKLTGNTRLTWLAAALFAVHPIHAEVVNEVVGRSELLAALFLFLALWFAVGRRRGHAAATLLCYLAALLSKEHAIVLLLLLPAVDLFAARSWRRICNERLPLYAGLAAVTAAWLVFRIWWLNRPMPPVNPHFVPLAGLEPLERILTAFKIQILYLGKLFWPYRLQGVYWDVQPVPGLLSAWGGGIGLVLLLAGTLALIGWRRRRWWGVAVVLYAISFAPTANLFYLTGVNMAERLVYFPSAWFCLGLAAALIPWLRLPRGQVFIPAAVVCGLAALSAVTVKRNVDFRTPTALYLSDLKKDPQNILALLYLGSEYLGCGDYLLAEPVYRRLVQEAPGFSNGLAGYAQLLLHLDRPALALDYAHRAELAGGVRGGRLPYVLAEANLRLGRPQEAISVIDALGAAAGEDVYLCEIRARAFELLGDREGALAGYRQAIALGQPVADDLYERTGALLLGMDRYAEAEEVLRQGIALLPRAASWNGLGIALALQSRPGEAREAFALAVAMAPDAEEYRSNLRRADRAAGGALRPPAGI